MKKNVCALIVTFNRKELLLKTIGALCRQTARINGLVIVNNHSDDGTETELFKHGIINDITLQDEVQYTQFNDIKVYYYNSSVNTGGSGGFAKAFEIAESLDYEYIWAMDDDVIPDVDCLEELLKHQTDECGVTIPNRYGDNWREKATVSYNLTTPFLHRIEDFKKTVYVDSIDADYVDVVDMALEGPLIAMNIARAVGIPDKEYFIMYDDTDFAFRLSRYTKIRLVKSAKLKRALTNTILNKTEWNWKTYYLTRNAFVFDRRYGKNQFVRNLRPVVYYLSKLYSAIRDGKMYRFRISRRAFIDFKQNNLGMTVVPGTKATEIR